MRQRREGVPAHATSTVFAIGLGVAIAASYASPAVSIAAPTLGAGPGDLDVLFMIDDSSDMTSMQTKLAAQIPAFIEALEGLPNGLPNIHVAVVSSDLGAPGNSTSVTCTTAGDQGLFRLSPSCTSSTLAAGETYVSNVGGNANYAGRNLADVVACIVPLGQTGCGFGHQLGSIARALGADGAPAPARNAGFLRSGADLAIIILSNADDCSAPPTTYLYSVNDNNNLSNAFGPLTHYRCNEFGHLCLDPSGDPGLFPPPETAPPDAQGTPAAPTLSLTGCVSLDTDGLLTPVSALVNGIKALKADPEHQIFVGAIVAPATPYTVEWVPAVGGQGVRPGELWPQIEHSCGSGDGSFGEPAVRITQLVNGFANGVSTSICDPSSSYGSLLSGLATKIGAHLQGESAPPTTSGAGDSGVGATGGGGGTVATDAGIVHVNADGGGIPGDFGSGGSSGSVRGKNGLTDGGCDISASGPGMWDLLVAGPCLLAARRRRAAARRSPSGVRR